MIIRFFDFEQYHARRDVGSTRIRVHNLIKYWPEAGRYQYGEKPDVLIFQKVYCSYDYKFPATYKHGLKILDACDPNWFETPDIYLKETLDGIDAVTVPTKALADFIKQMTDKPVVIIPDRFDIAEFPPPKKHTGNIKHLVWFGYAHNAELLRFTIPSLEKRNLKLTVISNEDPAVYKWANDREAYKELYKFVKYQQETVYSELQKADACLLPKGYRYEDRFKSDNKTNIALLCGLPVVSDSDELEAMNKADARNKAIAAVYDKVRREFDVKESIKQYKQLIKELS